MTKKGITILIAIFVSVICYAQDSYHNPESVVYDPNTDCYCVSSHLGPDHVYIYDNTLTNPPSQVPGSFDEPAGLHYNVYQDILAVPNFEGNDVYFFDLFFPESGSFRREYGVLTSVQC